MKTPLPVEVAIPPVVIVQTPPTVASVSVMLSPTHTVSGPAMLDTVGMVSIEMTIKVLNVPHILV